MVRTTLGARGMTNNDFYFDWQALLLIEPQQWLLGYISNEMQLCEQLHIKPGDQPTLIAAAAKRWGNLVNQHVLGDYIFIGLDQHQLFVSASARSSFSLYYQQHSGLKVAADLQQLKQYTEASVDETQLLAQLVLGPLAGEQTCYESIKQLQMGETLLWSLPGGVELTYRHQLSHAEQ